MSMLMSFRGVAGGDTPGAAPEIWSFGLWWNTVSGVITDPTQEDFDLQAQNALEDLQPVFGGSVWSVQQNVWLNECRLYHYPDESLRLPAALVGYSATDVYTPGAGNVIHPLQVALAVTLTTTGRSKPRFGRFYLPTLSYAVSSAGTVPGATVGAIADSIPPLLDALDSTAAAALNQDAELIIQSRTIADGPGEGASFATKPVTGIGVGNVYDTQRRRRNAIPESRAVRPYPPP